VGQKKEFKKRELAKSSKTFKIGRVPYIKKQWSLKGKGNYRGREEKEILERKSAIQRLKRRLGGWGELGASRKSE